MDAQVLRLLPFLDSDDLEIVLLFYASQQRDSIPCQTKTFRLTTFSAEYCFLNFRFYKPELKKLKTCLGIPRVLLLNNRLRVSGMEALCITLRRLAYPNRYVDLMKLFPRTRCELSRIFKHMVSFLMGKHGHLISGLNHTLLTIDYVDRLAQAVKLKGAPYRRCFGFLDGTVRAICRPGNQQREFYNGHKRVHSLKFQSVMLPNGIIASMFGPVNDRRHDAFILAESNLVTDLEQFQTPNNEPYFLYGDPAYPLLPHLIVPFKGHQLNRTREMCNKSMSSVRECVEWGFSKIVQNFAFLDFKKNLKVEMQLVSDYYLLSTIFTNCHTCCYGSTTSSYFNLDPPSLENYIG